MATKRCFLKNHDNLLNRSTLDKTPRRQLTNEPTFFKLQTVKQHTINPKALPRTQLLGQIDLDTRQWSNGVLTVAALQAVDEADDVNSWIICDGDVDPKWVESLNSVLDDNRSVTQNFESRT